MLLKKKKNRYSRFQFHIIFQEHGSAYEAGGLEVGQLILAVDGQRVEGMQHQEVARLIAESFAQRDKPVCISFVNKLFRT